MTKITADKITADKITADEITADEVRLDPVVEINNMALVLLQKISNLGSTSDLIRATSYVRLAADAVNQNAKK